MECEEVNGDGKCINYLNKRTEFLLPVDKPTIAGSDWGEPNGKDAFGNPSVHLGVVINPPKGTPIISSGNGVVHTADYCKLNPCNNLMTQNQGHAWDNNVNGGHGNVVVVEYWSSYLPKRIQNQLGPGESVFILYAHLDSINVKQGEIVRPGDGVGIVGSSGNSDGTHVHIEIRPGAGSDYGYRTILDQWWAWISMRPIINPHDIWTSIPYK
jgi:murein DD-endopeptidase MepM/ murein hydrolase activator NlpD